MNATAYIAINYQCNHRCTCCPCNMINQNLCQLSFLEIKDFVSCNRYDWFVISGGEPTLHPEFCDIVEYLGSIGRLTILSNADRFSDEQFASKFIERAKHVRVTVITTLHSHCAEKHEASNQTPGSFYRTLKGLEFLYSNDIEICIKHCITPDNYRDIKSFVRFVYDHFPSQVKLQFCGIDYTGMSFEKKQQAKHLVNFDKELESALDEVMILSKTFPKRDVYCLNIPLCRVDPFYWSFLIDRVQSNYNGYASTEYKSHEHQNRDLGCFSLKCASCDLREHCGGTYRSAFKLYGEEYVRPIINLHRM